MQQPGQQSLVGVQLRLPIPIQMTLRDIGTQIGSLTFVL